MLIIQLLTGIFLAMHYVPDINLAFSSVEHIMRDVNNGWFLRYLHANGASFFFIVVYIHIFRGLYYGSYIKPRHLVWCSGVIIFLVMMGTAFMGYVLPWGQMSFWGATVITNLFSAIPLVGPSIVDWLWGGFSVSQPTLNRFFSLHFLFPFVIAGLAGLHLVLLHQAGSSNPLGVYTVSENIAFYPYLYIKDLYGFFLLMFGYMFIVMYYPNVLGHADNYILANSMSTPAHIVPEWYFLPFYAILRSIPNKIGGAVAMFFSIIVLMLLPFINTSEVRSTLFRPLYRIFFWTIFLDFCFLGWIGQKPVQFPYEELGLMLTVYYFIGLLVILPLIGIFEKTANSRV